MSSKSEPLYSYRLIVFTALLCVLGGVAQANTVVTLGSISQITGPQDLDLVGDIRYAINFSANDPVRKVAGVQFIPDNQTIPGAVLHCPNEVTPWQNRPEFGASADANALEEIIHDIRWAPNPDKLSAQLAVTAGDVYKLQIIFCGNGFEDRKWDIRVNGQNAVDEITSLGASPGQSYSRSRATAFTYQFTALSNQVLVEMGSFFGKDEGGDRNPIWQALTLERINIPPAPADVALVPVQFFANQSTPIGAFVVTDGKSLPVSHTVTFASGSGDADNAKFTISGMQLLAQPFDFTNEPQGSVYHLRVKATDAADANRFLEKELSVAVATPDPPTAVTFDAAALSSAAVIGMLAGNLGATDADAFDQHAFALVNGAGSTDNALFSVSGTELRFAQVMPPGKTSVAIRLRATDLAGLSIESALTLLVIAPQLRVNEFLAGNTTGLTDEALVPQDWIEIRNDLAISVDIAGWYLSDDASKLTKWQFPTRVIGPNGFLVVFADGRGTVGGSSQLHTNFSLSGKGEHVILVKPDGHTIASDLVPPEQFANFTYGYDAAGTQLGYLVTPTPSVANSALATFGENSVTFSVPHGFKSANFSLTLFATVPGSTIRYTLDGSTPSADTGIEYAGPFMVTPDENGTTSGTRIVRAIAVHPEAVFATVATATYLFVNGSGRPNSSITSQTNLVTSITKNATYGLLLDDALLALPSLSVIIPNGLSTSENEASIELMNPTGAEPGFQINCGINATGTTSLGSPKLSMAAKFRQQYGPSRLKYPVFAVGSTAPVGAATEFKELRLRSHSHDTFYWLGTAENPPVPYGSPEVKRSGDAQLMRNLWMDEMQLRMGQPGKRGRQVHLYLNGSYHGLYHVHEHPDEDFMASYYPGTRNDYHFTGAAITGSDHGNGDSWTQPWSELKNSLGDYTEAKRWVDVTNLADYMVESFYAGNDWDWSTQHNWGAAGPKTIDSGGWKFFQQDSDITFQDVAADCTDQEVPDGIFNALMNAHADFRVLFRDRAYKHCYHGGALTPAIAGAFYDASINEIYTAIVAETARWQPGSSVSALPWDRNQEWVNEWKYMKNTFFPKRTATLIAQLRLHPGWWPVEPVEMNQQGGSVANGFRVTFKAPAGIIYYTTDGSDPRLPGGGVNPSARTSSSPLVIASPTLVRVRAFANDDWSALNEASFVLTGTTAATFANFCPSEIHFHPADLPDTEFIEFVNTSISSIDASGVRLTGAVEFFFPVPSVLAPGSRIIVAKDAALFDARYRTSGSPWYHAGIKLAGVWNGSLANSGESLTVLAASGAAICTFAYSDSGVWPDRADGRGSSAEVINPSAIPITSAAEKGDALSDGNNWRPSAEYHGTPGWPGTGSDNRVIINEVLSASVSPATDMIELYNTTRSAIAIGGWFLSDDGANLQKYRIPAGTVLPAGGYVAFHEDSNFGLLSSDPGRLIGFGLSSAGATVYLTAAVNDVLTDYRTQVTFGPALEGETIGNIYKASSSTYDFVPLANATPGAANSGARVGPIVITEIHYQPGASVSQDAEFVELTNVSASPVTLYDQVKAAPWRMTEGILFDFPSDTPLTMQPGQRIILTRSLSQFNASYTVPGGTLVYQWNSGGLSDLGEPIELSRPGGVNAQNVRQYVRVDPVHYSPNAPWPGAAAGYGYSLHKIAASNYGNDFINWTAVAPSPGDVTPLNPYSPSITTATLSSGVKAVFYSQTLTATAATAPATWTLGSGTMPTGLNLSAAGIISGTPTITGIYNFAIKLTDNAGLFAVKNFTLTIHAAYQVPVVNAFTLGTTTIGMSFNATMTATNLPKSFTITGLPTGLTANLTTGAISGRASARGVFTVQVKATNSAGSSATITAPLVVKALSPNLIGSFTGVIGRDAAANAGLGARLTLATTATGTYTAKITKGATTLMSPTTPVPYLNATAPQITITLGGQLLSLTLDPVTNLVSGTYGAAGVDGWRSTWNAINPATNRVGYYSVGIDLKDSGDVGATSIPQGSGYASFSVTSLGALTVAGKASDGSAISSAGFIGPSGEIAVYTPLYANLGSVVGKLTLAEDALGAFADNTASGALTWFKPTTVTRTYKTQFGPINLDVYGKYLASNMTSVILGLPSTGTATLDFTEAGTAPSVTNPDVAFNYSSTNLVTIAGNNPGKTTLTISKSSGAVSGTVTLADTTPKLSRVVPYQGMIVRPASGNVKAKGYLLVPQKPLTGEIISTSPILSGSLKITE